MPAPRPPKTTKSIKATGMARATVASKGKAGGTAAQSRSQAKKATPGKPKAKLS